MSWEIRSEGRDRYLAWLRRIVSDDVAFARFRQNADIRGIIDGVTPAAARTYLRRIETLAPGWAATNWARLARNDEVGSPALHGFGHASPLAPINLRYAWNALEMDTDLSLAGKTIVEVGGGYGGLARIVCDLFAPAEYCIIDLPEAQAVAQKFLARFDLKTPIRFLPLDAVTSADVFIANYSVAEFDRPEQRRYLDNVMLQARCGYFTHNIPQPSRAQMSRAEFEQELSRRFDVRSYVEGLERCEQSVVYVCRPKVL